MTTVRVKCTWEIEVQVPDDWDDAAIRFDIESNHCPATGLVGAALNDAIREGERMNVCWACGDPRGENKVLEVRRKV